MNAKTSFFVLKLGGKGLSSAGTEHGAEGGRSERREWKVKGYCTLKKNGFLLQVNLAGGSSPNPMRDVFSF